MMILHDEWTAYGRAWRSLPIYKYKPSNIPIMYIPNPFYQMTVQHRGPSTPNSPPARYEMLSQKLFRNCQVKRQSFQFQQITSNLSKSSTIYHFFHQNIQTFISPPVPMFLSKNEVQSIQNTQQTVMRYQPYRCTYYKTTQNADPLPSSFSKIKRIK